MNKIPKGWEKVKFEDVLKYEQPSKYIVKSTKYNNDYKTPVLTAGKGFILGYTNETDGIFKDTPVIIFDDFTTSSQYVNFHFKVKSSAMKILRPVDNVNLKFLFYKMQTIQHKSDTHKRYWISEYAKREIYIPNLVEQKAIVDKLDDSFAKIENAIINLINAKENLKLYKQSVLKSAFNGDLLPNTSPTHWEVKKLGEICEINPKTEILLLNESDEVSFIPMASVEAETNIFTESKSKFSKVKKGYTKFRDNDILFAKITPCMENGKICIVNNLKFGIGFGSTEFHVIRPNKNTLSKYIYYFVSQISFRQMAQIYMTGAVGQRRVPSKILENCKIPLPPLSEQNLIVAEIDRRFAIVDKTLNLIDKSIQNAKNLKQSILKKAFSGELRSEI
ncbi:restriction endonuclease subunit S [uncultured Campylobacter sp.]|uniref:restriction endonuclease subunit S n=1 Tax=uncultured Campylobacter sp. TaxID=218934 RepID=UPI002609CE92|nr:restriction endonuclease subunit S [uncultured Campylobacter sp.]